MGSEKGCWIEEVGKKQEVQYWLQQHHAVIHFLFTALLLPA